MPESLRVIANSKQLFEIQWVKNTGPYRKLIPVLEHCFEFKTNPIIITCDDDVIYPRNFLDVMVSTHLAFDAIVACRGYTMSISGDVFDTYRTWQGNEKKFVSILNLPTGKDGILYRPKYFDVSVVRERDFLRVAPSADDIWLKWHTAVRATPVVLLSAIGFPELRNSQEVDTRVSLYRKYNKAGGNDAAITKIEQHFVENFGEALCHRLVPLAALECEPISTLSSRTGTCLKTAKYDEAFRLIQSKVK
ncbi:MAG: hypothetical protein IPK02_14070 [Candidatus Accumulibacter sp.]|uniref:Glycosyltransferase 2-like domain-containing protein n=1 Tax=Candidatus Accumulibacter affinis TaxID=2954384 RepID=A0A935TEQ9_9PROT|nr:hypothetical protein [Candidatus Accumulibacter affinis]